MENNASLNLVILGADTAAGRETVRQAVVRGHHVTAFVRGSDHAAWVREAGALPAYSDSTRAGELKSILTMAQANAIIDLSPTEGYGFPLRSADEHAIERILTRGATALVEAAAEAGAPFVVYVSSAVLYGDQHGAAVDEHSHAHPDPLFRTLAQAEKHVLGGSVPACALRAGFVYGPGDAATTELGEALRHSRAIYVGDGHATHNWIHAADLAAAAILAAEQRPAGAILNVVDDEPTSAAAFAATMGKVLGLEEVSTLTGFMIQFRTTPMQRALLAASAKVQNGAAKQTLGWSPRYPSQKAGLDQTFLHWRAEMQIKA
jgi:nucleoside-diphosphate-sugar epimerase